MLLDFLFINISFRQRTCLECPREKKLLPPLIVAPIFKAILGRIFRRLFLGVRNNSVPVKPLMKMVKKVYLKYVTN